MYQSKSDLPVDGEIDDEKIPTGELDWHLGDEIFREKAQNSRDYRKYKFSDFEVDNVPAVRIWEMNDGRYFLKWDNADTSGFEVFETSRGAETEFKDTIAMIKE
jgi:hypothetical protein